VKSSLAQQAFKSHSIVPASSTLSTVNISQSHTAVEDQPKDLWNRAYKLLREDESNIRLLEPYEKVLLSELQDVDVSRIQSTYWKGYDREQQLSALITKKLQVVDKARWRFNMGNETIEFKAQIDRIVKAVLYAKDAVSSALNSDPHAALAWAGVCVLLPVCI